MTTAGLGEGGKKSSSTPGFVDDPPGSTAAHSHHHHHHHQTTGSGGAGSEGKDDEALSSLLLLLKSNANNNDETNIAKDSKGKRSATGSERSLRGETTSSSGKTIKMEDLRGYFHLPIVEVAKQLGTCTTALKKICRKNKIKKWPYRQIRSITKSIQSLEMASLNDSLQEELRAQYREQITYLQKAIDELIRDPNAEVDVSDIKLSDGDNSGDEDNTYKISRSVQQIMMAAAATAVMETSSSSSSGRGNTTKRKAADDSESHKEKADHSYQNAMIPPPLLPISVGETTVTQVNNVDGGNNKKSKVHFVGPVQLAALQRKKLRITKKLVPLIEPDICNNFKMDFLPHSILQYKYLTPAPDMNTMLEYQQIVR